MTLCSASNTGKRVSLLGVLAVSVWLLIGTPANAQAVTWKLNVAKSQYKPGTMPIKVLTIAVEESRDGVRVTARGEQNSGLPINYTYFTSWDSKSDHFSPQDLSDTQARYYNAIILPFGSPACFNANGAGEACISFFGHHNDAGASLNTKNASVEISTNKRWTSDCFPTKSRLVFQGESVVVATSKGTNADGKFEQIFVFERQ